jgi:HAD superfamily hydrolase (TIGR01509 family)
MIDSEPLFAEAARQLLARRGRELDLAALRGMMGTPARQALALFQEHYQLTDSIEELAAESRELFFAILDQRTIPLLPGVLELLDRLEAHGIPRAIATSSSRAYVATVLEPYHLVDRFAFVLTAEDVQLGKPFPEVYEKAAARFDQAPAEMVVLEDSVNGMKAARSAGARCIVVPHDLVPRDALGDADVILDSLADGRVYQILGLEPPLGFGGSV